MIFVKTKILPAIWLTALAWLKCESAQNRAR